MMWQNVDKNRPDSAHYSVMCIADGEDEMEALKMMFPEGTADDLNVVLFSTSGVHGTYTTIEEIEETLHKTVLEAWEDPTTLTFLIVHPRLVALRYGTVTPKTQDDIDFLKRLRSSSQDVAAKIGT